MKPILDISSKNSFTVWESCVWKDGFSSSVLVSDFASGKMQVIYDKDPTKSATHALFYANVGNVLAGCFIQKNGPKTERMNKFNAVFPGLAEATKSQDCMVRIELVRIESLSTKIVQGHTQPTAVLTPLFLSSTPMSLDFESVPDLTQLIGRYETQPSVPNARELMEQAIAKAMTPPARQKMFWGIPRVKQEEY